MPEEPATPSLWSAIVAAKEALLLLGAIVVVIGWVYTMKAEVDDDHSQIIAMLSRNVNNRLGLAESKLTDLAGINSRVQSLADTLQSAHDANISQFQAMQTQVQSLSSSLHEVTVAVASIQQGQATATAQLQFLISQTTTDGKRQR